MGRWPLRVHAPRARDRARRRALPTTETVDRARVREHQVQPALGTLPPTRQIRGAHGMAPDHRHPQPLEAPQAPARRRGRLTAAASDPIASSPTNRKVPPPPHTHTLTRQPHAKALASFVADSSQVARPASRPGLAADPMPYVRLR